MTRVGIVAGESVSWWMRGVRTTRRTEIGEDVEEGYNECKEDDADRGLVHEELRCAGSEDFHLMIVLMLLVFFKKCAQHTCRPI